MTWVLVILAAAICSIILFLRKRKKKSVKVKKPNIEQVFHGFVGNEETITAVKRILKYHNQKDQGDLPPIAFFGPRSTGKTELFRRIASAVDMPAISATRDDFVGSKFYDHISPYATGDAEFGFIKAPPMIVFIDEVHAIPRQAQDALLKALEQEDRAYLCKKGEIDTSNIFWIVASTDPGKLTEAFRSRFVRFNLRPYSVEEVTQMLSFKTNQIPQDGLLAIAKAGRGIPREAFKILSIVKQGIELGEFIPSKYEILKDIQTMIKCDENGITDQDKKYLKFVGRHEPAGLSTICQFMQSDKDNILNVVEPYLIQQELVIRTPSGRKLTSKGKSYLIEEDGVQQWLTM